jgi:hypothetical protein
LHGSFIVALEIALVCDPAVVDEALSAREVVSVAVNANQLDSLAIRTLYDARSCLLLRLRVAVRQGL